MEPEKIKESILRAAKELFRKYGYHKTSVNEIAKKARIAKATIYKYFESKEQILDFILMDYLDVNLHGILSNSSSNLLFKPNKKSYKAAFTKYGNISFWKVTKFLRTSESLTEVKANENTMLLLAFNKNASPPRRAGLFLK